MRIFRKLIKYVLPYSLVRLYQKSQVKKSDKRLFEERMLEEEKRLFEERRLEEERRINEEKILEEKKILPKIENFEIINGSYAFAPWLSDTEFNNVFEKIKNYTLLGNLKSYVLWELVKQTKFLAGASIEIGVWRGGSGILIAKQIINTTLYLCDTFTGVVKTGKKDSFYKDGAHADTSIDVVEGIFKELDLNNYKILKGIFPDETCSMINDRKFKFCHIDVDVYQSTKDIFYWIWPRMVIGGIILIDDYGYHVCDGVTKFVNEEKLKPDRIVINNWVGQAIIIKLIEDSNG